MSQERAAIKRPDLITAVSDSICTVKNGKDYTIHSDDT